MILVQFQDVTGRTFTADREEFAFDEEGWEAFCALAPAEQWRVLAAKWIAAGMRRDDAILAGMLGYTPVSFYSRSKWRVEGDEARLRAWARQHPEGLTPLLDANATAF